MLLLGRVLVWPLCRLQVSGTVPAELRGRPLILAANHVSPIDPIVMTAAFHVAGIAPRVMATGGLFDAPIAGAAMRAARGDRHFDLATLRFYLAGQAPQLAGPVDERLADISEHRRRAYWAHLSLRQVDWSIRHHDAATVRHWVEVAEAGMGRD